MDSGISVPALSGLTIPTLTVILNDDKPYRAKQVFSWIAQGAQSFNEMTNLPLQFRKELAKHFVIRKSRVTRRLEDRDGTVKLRLCLEDGASVETVLLAAPDTIISGHNPELSDHDNCRFTACLSTQVGCPIGCVFCKTGSLGFLRNLGTSEIIDQFLYLSDIVRERNGGRISNIVVMGMGEPLLNLEVLRTAMDILCSKSGFNCSKRKITVSTSGIAKGILDMAENGPQAELALSLTSAREALRNRLMPGVQGNSLAQIKEALRVYQKKQGRRITLEMVLLGGINTGEEEARALAAFASDLSYIINLIPWNPVEGLQFEEENLREPEEKEIESFRVMLEQRGLAVTRRYRRGRSISGACGQLGMVQCKESTTNLTNL